MKNTIILLSLIMFTVFSVGGCAQSVDAPVPESEPIEVAAEQPEEEAPPPPAPAKPFKIGIITGTTEDCPDEYRVASEMKGKYGDIIEISLYPDIFQPKTETLWANMRALADTGAQAIVMSPCGPGTADAINRLRGEYPDMLFIGGTISDVPELMASNADIALSVDDGAFASATVRQARKMGAKVFVHYTFARHMGNEAHSSMRDMFNQACEDEQIQFVDATIPDPQGDGGVSESTAFVRDDVPKKVAAYGKDTAFYSTEETVQETLINSVLWEGALFPVQCIPSPFFAYPKALGIEIPYDKMGDVSYVLEQIQKEIIAKGGEGRFSTLPVIINAIFIEAGTEYALAFLNGDIRSRNDSETLKGMCVDAAGGAEIVFSNYDSPSGRTLKNYYFVLPDFISF